MDINGIGKIIIFAGVVLIIFGLLMLIIPKITSLGKLPGDIYFKKGNYSFYFPVVISIILSIVLTVILNIVLRFK